MSFQLSGLRRVLLILACLVLTSAGLVVVQNGRSGGGEESATLPEVADLSVDPSADYTKHYNFDLLPDLKTCGMSWQIKNKKNSTRSKRVVGGKLVKLGKYPWLGRLELYEGGSGNSSERCGSSLINSRYVLTAAHCVTRVPSGHSLTHISFGTVDTRKTRQCVDGKDTACTTRKRYEVEDILIHEDYITGSLMNDIALIRLTEDVKFDDFVRPICLPRDEKLLSKWKSSKITVAGFGRSNGDDDRATYYPAAMHEVELPLVPRSDCEMYYKRRTGQMDKSRFCAGGEFEKGDCKGDSGGPLMKTLTPNELNEERVFQFGLVSFGLCALEGVPGGYINILYYMPWILDNIEP